MVRVIRMWFVIIDLLPCTLECRYGAGTELATHSRVPVVVGVAAF